MKHLLILAITASIAACNNDTAESERPRDPNEAITDSTRIVNDSVIVIDSNNKGIDPSKHDTSKTKVN
jgi:hypothetical protein